MPDSMVRQVEGAPFQGMLQAAPVAERGVFDHIHQLQRRPQRILALVQADVQVHAADAEGIDLPVQLGVERFGLGHIAVRADAFHPDALSFQGDLDLLVALGTPQADADCSFHYGLRNQG